MKIPSLRRIHRFFLPLALASSLTSVSSTRGLATTATFCGQQFEVVNDGGLWAVGSTGTTLSVTKPVDALTVNAQSFTFGGLKSQFAVDGDFNITVDYELPIFVADVSNQMTLNESILEVEATTAQPAPFFEILRFVDGGTAVQRIEAFSDAAGSIGGQIAPPAIITSGRYRIARSGDVVTAFYAAAGSESFTIVGSQAGFSGPMRVRFEAVQGVNAAGYNRAYNAIAVSYGNMIITGMISTTGTDGEWLSLLTAGPYSRNGHAAVYDPVRDRMVVFGGSDGVYHNDALVLSLSGSPTWTQLTPTGTPPVARRSHTAIYDPVRQRMVVFGGYDGTGSSLNDAWALSLSGSPTWTQLTPTGTPPSGTREGTSAIYDPVRDRMVVFGGRPGDSHAYSLSLSESPTWTQLTPAGTPPSGRQWPTTIYDPVRDRMVVFGGNDGSVRNDTWGLSLSGSPAWAQLTPTGTPPSSRYAHTAVYDPVRDRMVVFGGNDGSARNDAWALSLSDSPAWTQLSPASTLPAVRSGHTAIYDPMRDHMVVFGGSSVNGIYGNDTWALNWGTPEPMRPVLVSPEGGADVTGNIAFAWQSLPSVASYQIALFAAPDLLTPVWTRVTNSTSSAYSVGSEFPFDATYYWSVRALQAGQWGPYAAARTVHRLPSGGPLAAPILSAPENGAQVGLPDDFSWTLVPGATAYDVEFSNTSTFASPSLSTTSIANHVRLSDVGAPNVGQTYYWHVRALAPGAQSSWTPPGSFIRVTSAVAPSAPTLVAPAQGGNVTGPSVAFAWQPASSSTSYDLLISRSIDFPPLSGTTWSVEGIYETSRVVDLGVGSTTLYWKVIARNSAGVVPSSPVRSFQYDLQSIPLSSCVILSPSSGSSAPQDAVVLASALVAGQYAGTVNVEWFLDGASISSTNLDMVGKGLRTTDVQVPTSSLGGHSLTARVTGPQVVQSSPAMFTVVSRTFGSSSSLSVVAGNPILDTGETTTLYCRVLDAQGRLVENDAGRAISFAAQGGGALSLNPVIVSGGVASVDYTAPASAADVLITASSSGMQAAAIKISVRPQELERLKAEANAYLDRLGSLRWDFYSNSIGPTRSLNVEVARARVSGASSGDEPRLRRLNMLLRVMDRSYYYDPQKHAHGPREASGEIPGVQVLYDDAVQSLGHITLTAIAMVSRFDHLERQGNFLTAPIIRVQKEAVISALDHGMSLALLAVPDGPMKRFVSDSWSVTMQVASELNAQNPGGIIASLTGYPVLRATLGDFGLVTGYVEPTQKYLDDVVYALFQPGWVGGADTTPTDYMNAALQRAHDRSSAQNQTFNETLSRVGLFSAGADLQDILSHWTGPVIGMVFQAGAVLYRLCESAIVWATGVDCQTVAWQIVNIDIGSVAQAVVHDFSTSAPGVQPLPLVSSGQRGAELNGLRGTTLSASRAVRQVLQSSSTNGGLFESRLRDLESSLSAADTNLTQSSLEGLYPVRQQILEDWAQLLGVLQSTSNAAMVTYSNYPSTTDSLAIAGNAAMSSVTTAVMLAGEWLSSPSDEALRLAAKLQVQDAIDHANSYTAGMTGFITELFTTYSEPYLHVEIPATPDILRSGETGIISTVVRNLGASTAHDVTISVSANSSQLEVLAPAVITVDSLMSGQDVTCNWHAKMLVNLGAVDSSLAVVGSVVANAPDAIGSSTSFLISTTGSQVTGVHGPNRVPSMTTIGRIYPNPATDLQTFEILIAPKQRLKEMRVYDVQGRLVFTGDLRSLGPGTHLFRWDGRGNDGQRLASGVYFAAIKAPSGLVSRKLVLVR